MAKIGRNDPCRCGSGKKYKRCCMVIEELEAEQRRLNAEAERLAAEKARLEAINTAVHGLLADEAEFAEITKRADEAQELISGKRLDEAEQLARELDADYPKDPIGAERLAQVYEARGMIPLSVEEYRRAVGIMDELGEGQYCDCCRARLVKAIRRLDPDHPAPVLERDPV
jgi:hypothetical protein